MAARGRKSATGGPVEVPSVPVDPVRKWSTKSGWCMAGQHPECLSMRCGCTDCPEEVHHSRMNQRQVVTYGQTLVTSLTLVDGDGLVDDQAEAA